MLRSEPVGTATGLALSPRETPQSVSIVTRQQIDDRNIKSLAEALRTTTGMAESAYDTERSSFSYRGFSVENYLYDGVPTTRVTPSVGSRAAWVRRPSALCCQ